MSTQRCDASYDYALIAISLYIFTTMIVAFLVIFLTRVLATVNAERVQGSKCTLETECISVKTCSIATNTHTFLVSYLVTIGVRFSSTVLSLS